MSQGIWKGPELESSGAESLVSLLMKAAARSPRAPALIDAPTGATTNYGELADRVLRVASSLAAAGLKKGDVVATLTPNSPAWVVFTLGVMAAGGIVTGLNPMLKREELAKQITIAGAARVAVAGKLLPMVRTTGIDKLVNETLILDDGEAAGEYRTLAALIREGSAQPRTTAPDDVVLLPFSSGTSGLPKGVQVTGRSLALSGMGAGTALGLTGADIWLAAGPLFHIVAVSGVLASALTFRIPVVIIPIPELDAVFTAIARYRVTITVLTPPAIRAIAGPARIEGHDFSSLRAIGCTAAPLSAEAQVAASRRIGVPVFQAYGMTESVGAISIGPIADSVPGSSGMPGPGFEVCIVDPASGRDAARGEIWIRSPMMTRGYHRNPDATAEMMTPDGWMRTGDLGYFDDTGHLFVVDRIKELIKVGPSQVAPAELEALVATYPGVADVAVVGRPSPDTGECPVACVVAAEPIDPSALMSWVAERVAPFKRLHAVEFVDAIPRQPNGKIMRRMLRERRPAPVAHA